MEVANGQVQNWRGAPCATPILDTMLALTRALDASLA